MSKLSASARPFTFNPNAKSFVFAPAATLVPVVVPTPPPRITYTNHQLFSLQQPLYSGSSLIFPTDCPEHLNEILLYDPCFDYISAGLITAVPIEEAQQQMQGENGGEMQYDMIMQKDSAFPDATMQTNTTAAATTTSTRSSPRTSPRKTRKVRSTRSSPPLPDDTSSTTLVPEELRELVVDGVRQMESGGEEEGGEDDEEDEDESEEEDDQAEDDDTLEGEQQQQQQYHPPVWTPQTSTSITSHTDDSSINYQSSQKYYYFNTAPTYQHQYDQYASTSLHADRRRQKQSDYFSHFTNHSSSKYSGGDSRRYNNNHSSSNNNYSSPFSSQRGDSHTNNSGSTYSPPLMAQRRGMYFEQDLHLHLNEAYTKSNLNASNQNRTQYSRDKLLELGAKEQCKVIPKHLPAGLADIYKSSPTNAHGSSSRSLFNSSSSSSSAAASSSIFNSLTSSSSSSSHLDPTTPKGGKKDKEGRGKKKKNKDRSERSMEDSALVTPRMSRERLNSFDQMEEECKQEEQQMTGKKGKNKNPVTPATKGKQPGLMKQNSSMKNNNNGKQSQQQQQQPLIDPFENVTMADLHHTENAWVRSSATKDASSSSAASTAASAASLRQQQHAANMTLIGKTVRSILNKLSPDTFESLLQSLIALPIQNKQCLSLVVDIIFDKSIDEPPFAQLYASFCSRLSDHLPEFPCSILSAIGGSDGDEGKPVKMDSFRTLLLTRCYKMLVEDDESFIQTQQIVHMKQQQQMIQQQQQQAQQQQSPTSSSSPPPPQQPQPLTSLEISERLSLLKMHQKGNLIFIGELFKHSLIRYSVIHLCLDMLLEQADQLLEEEQQQQGMIGNTTTTSGGGGGGSGSAIETSDLNEWDVECVCIFMNTVGEKLDDFPKEMMNLNGKNNSSSNNSSSSINNNNNTNASHEETNHELLATRRALVESHFNKIRLLSRNKSLPSRFRFMLLDLLDLRQRKWIPRIKKVVDPKSLLEMQAAEAAVAAASSTLMTPQGKGNGYGYGYGNSSSSPNFGGNGYQTTGGKKGGGTKSIFQNQSSYQPQAASRYGTTLKPAPKRQPSYQGRALQFESSDSSSSHHSSSQYHNSNHPGNFNSPMLQRSISAPDRNDRIAMGSPLVFHPLNQLNESSSSSMMMASPAAAASSSSSTTVASTATTTGKYIPAWKRRELGLEVGGVLPRSQGNSSNNLVGVMGDGGSGDNSLHDGDEEPDTEREEREDREDAAELEELQKDGIIEELLQQDDDEEEEEAIDLDTLQNELDLLVEEYYSSHDLEEAYQCFTELTSHYRVELVISNLIVPLLSKAVEMKQVQRELAKKLVEEVWMKQSENTTPVLITTAFLRGLQSWINLLSDIAIDIPHAPQHTNELLAHLIYTRRISLVSLFPLYKHAMEDEGTLVKEDAVAWMLVIGKEVKKMMSAESTSATAQTTSLAALIAPPSTADSTIITTTPATSSSSSTTTPPTFSFFFTDSAAARLTLEQAGLSELTGVLVPTTTA